MTSKQIIDILNTVGEDKLYKMSERYFSLVDKWESRLVDGDLLNELELSEIIDRLTGCQIRFGIIAGALEAYKEFLLQDTLVKLINEKIKEKGKITGAEESEFKAKARLKAEEIGGIASDFRNYFYSSQSAVTSAQSRIKRLTVIKGSLGVDFTGEQPIDK